MGIVAVEAPSACDARMEEFMKVIIPLAILLAVTACRSPDRSDPASTKTTVSDLQAKPPPVRTTPRDRAVTDRAKLEAFRAMKRARAYEREGQARVPAVVAQQLAALRPVGIPYKTVRSEAYRAMKLLKHTPTHAQYKLRLVTTVRGGDLRTALEAPLRAAGWLGADMTLRTPLERADGSVLEVKLTEPDEMPSVVDFIFTTKNPQSDMETPSLLLSKPPLWPALLEKADIVGYEFGHFHATRPGGVYTDIERSAVLYAVKGARKHAANLGRALVARGFTRDDDGEILRGPEGASLVLKTPGDARLLVHYQRRWDARPAAQPVKTPGKKAPSKSP